MPAYPHTFQWNDMLRMLQEPGMTWRVDKDDGPTLFNRMRGNLLALAGSDRRATRLRALLIDRQPPRVVAAERCHAEQQPDEAAQVRGFPVLSGDAHVRIVHDREVAYRGMETENG